MIPDDLAAALRLDPTAKRALLAKLARARPVPLSFAQRRLWLLDRLGPATPAYNVPVAFRLRGPLDRAALAGALDDIVQRHDVLRSVVRVKNGEPFTHLVADFRLQLAQRELPAAASLGELLARESASAFDLSAAPPIRALLVRIENGDHVLLVTIHHIAADGWSMDVFGRELSAFYAARRAGAPARLPVLRARYADFVLAQRERLAGDTLERGLRYWREHLRAAAPCVEFPAVLAAGDETAVGCAAAALAPPMRAALAQFAQTHGATLFSTLLSIWYLVLARRTGQCDLVVGAAVSNRTRSAYEDLIGFFVNTLPLRVHVDSRRPFADLLAAVHSLALEGFEHAEIPLERVVEELHPARIAGRAPLVNAMFVLQNAPLGPLELAGLEVLQLPLEPRAAKFDILLDVADASAGVALSIEYRASLFAPADIRGMLDAFVTIAQCIARGDQRPVALLPALGSAVRSAQLAAAQGAVPALSGLSVAELFERTVQLRPDAAALRCADERLSYRALNARANRLAHHLRALGVARGSRVGIAAERGSPLIVGILAIVKAGGVYVPLNADDPRERLAFMLADAGLRIVLAERRSAVHFRALPCRTIALDDDTAWRAAPAANPSPTNRGDDPAYVMYTSGSTGTPKGVLVAHRGIERLVASAGCVTIRVDDAVAFASTPAFDASTFELWGALINGACLVVVPKDVVLTPNLLSAQIAACGISIMFVTTALFREIVRKAPSTFGGLRVLLVGGEKLDRESVCRLAAAAAPGALVNAYGPTEATTFAAAFSLDPRAKIAAEIPIGRPIANTELLILDEQLELLPHGARGQLYIGGPGLALGYLNDPARTADRFIAHPHSREPGARLYATGDLARFGADGTIEFAGRLDAQLKLRGFRIEPAEIEAALRLCAGVSDAVVVPRVDAGGTTRLAAYVTGDGAPEAIAIALRARLPAHLVPNSIDALAHFPLTRSGKLDVRALPPPARASTVAAAGRVVSELQQQLVTIWESLLGVAPIGVRDNFFVLGGHSLLAVRLAGEIEQQLGVRLPLAALFERPTIEQLAELLRADPASLNASPLIALNAQAVGRPLIFLHGSLAGGGYYCRGLAAALGDRPLYALRPHGVDGRALPASIEAIAAECLAEIRAVAPRGPYLLGGFCSGGLVAFEVALQLAARGESVERLVLIDVPHGGRRLQAIAASIDRLAHVARVPAARRSTLRAAGIRLARRIERFVLGRDKLAALRRFAVRRVAAACRRGARAADVPLTANGEPAIGAGGVDAVALNVAWTGLTEAYVPRPYTGHLSVLLSEQCRTTCELGAEGWNVIAPQAEIRPIPGRHLTCITDHIAETSAAVAQALQGAAT